MKNLFQNLPEEERAQALIANCTSVEKKYKVQRHFTKEELDELRTNVSDELIDISSLEDKLKLVAAPIREEMAVKKVVLKEKLKLVKQKYEESEEEVYLLADQDSGFMLYYDYRGELINSRKLMPHERQHRLVDINQSKDQKEAV